MTLACFLLIFQSTNNLIKSSVSYLGEGVLNLPLHLEGRRTCVILPTFLNSWNSQDSYKGQSWKLRDFSQPRKSSAASWAEGLLSWEEVGRKNKLRVSFRLTLILHPFLRKSKDIYKVRRVTPMNLVFSIKWTERSICSQRQSHQCLKVGGAISTSAHRSRALQNLCKKPIPFVLQVHEITSPWVHRVCCVCTTFCCEEVGTAQTPKNFANFSAALCLAFTPSFRVTLL